MKQITAKVVGAVIVTRVSTGEQVKHGTSLESQLSMCRAKAAALGIPIVAEYEDAGISGAFLRTREGIQKALEDIREGRANTLIFASSSRMTREREHMEIIKRSVHSEDGRIVFCDMDYTDTPAGNLHLNVKNDFEVYERTLFRERSMKGKRTRAQNGIQPQRSLSPYGYHIPSKEDVMQGRYPLEQLGRYVVIEEQAAIVRRIYSCYAAGTHSMHRLCQELNAEGIATPRGAAVWRPASIKAVLANPVHKGEAAFGKVRHRKSEERLLMTNPLTGRLYTSAMIHQAAEPEEIVTLAAPAIVSEEIWEQVQRRRAHNKANKGGCPARMQILTGFAACPVCGGGMRYVIVKQGLRQYRYYQCHAHVESKRAGAPSACDKTVYLVDDAEAAVLTCLNEALTCPESINAQIAAYLAPGQDAAATRLEIAAVDRALSEIAQQEGAAVQAQIRGIMAGASPDAYAEAFGQIAARRKDLEDRRGQLRRTLTAGRKSLVVGDAEMHRQALTDVHRVLTSPDIPNQEKRDALGILVEKVICRKGGAEIVFQQGLFSDLIGDSVHGVSTPEPRNAIVRPFASSAP